MYNYTVYVTNNDEVIRHKVDSPVALQSFYSDLVINMPFMVRLFGGFVYDEAAHTLWTDAKRQALRFMRTFLKEQFWFLTTTKPLMLVPNPRVAGNQRSATLLHASIHGNSACSRCSLQAIFCAICFKRGLNWFLMKKQLESAETHEEVHLCSIKNSLCYRFFSC